MRALLAPTCVTSSIFLYRPSSTPPVCSLPGARNAIILVMPAPEAVPSKADFARACELHEEAFKRFLDASERLKQARRPGAMIEDLEQERGLLKLEMDNRARVISEFTYCEHFRRTRLKLEDEGRTQNVIQDSLLKFLTFLDKGRQVRAKIVPFEQLHKVLSRMVKHKRIDVLRSEKLRRTSDVRDHPGSEPSPPAALETQELAARIWKLLPAVCSSKEACVFIRVRLEDKSLKEAGESCGVAEDTVSSYVLRCREKIIKRLGGAPGV